MGQQVGRSLLIKRGNGASPEVFTTVCGFKARTFGINNNIVDTTVPDCVTPSGKVAEQSVYGIQSMQFSGSGIFDNDAASVAVKNAARNQTANTNYQVVVPGDGTYTGVFLVESFQYSGAEEGNMEFEATFRASGTITFAAE